MAKNITSDVTTLSQQMTQYKFVMTIEFFFVVIVVVLRALNISHEKSPLMRGFSTTSSLNQKKN